MAYDLEEQEKIASLKAWWEQYGNALTSIVLGVAIAVAGYFLWQRYKAGQNAAASATYAELATAASNKDVARVREFAGTLFDKYGSSAYAQMGALVAAKANADAGDAKTAEAELRWAAEHAIDPEYRALGRLRLAGLLLDQGRYDDANRAVSQGEAKDLAAPLQAAFADRRGDIAMAAGKADDAKREYRAAIALLESRSETRGYVTFVQLKLDSVLGGVVAVAAPAPPPAPAAPAPEKKP